MHRTRNAIIVGVAALLLIAALFLPSMLQKLPTRYAMRLPEPLQSWALPPDPTPILPTAEAPTDLASLLGDANVAQAQVQFATATPPPTPTALPASNSAVLLASPTPLPSPSPLPLPAEEPLPNQPTNLPPPVRVTVDNITVLLTPIAVASVNQAVASAETLPVLLEPTATAEVAATTESAATPEPAATSDFTPSPNVPVSLRMEGVTHIFQDWNNCGPATLAMGLSYFGLDLDQTDTAAVLKPSAEDRNVSVDEMVAYVNEQTELRAITRTNGDIETLQELMANDVAVIIELGIEPPGEYRWLGWYGHYLMLVAYDNELEQFWVYDSWFGTSEELRKNTNPDGRQLTFTDLDRDWPQFNRNYIAIYRPEQQAIVDAIIGDNLDDRIMWQRSLEKAQVEAAADPASPFYWFNLGTSYNALGEYEKAAAAFDQARSIGLPWRMLWYQFGPYEAYYQVGRYEDVVLLADAALQDRPYLEEAFYFKGIALQAMGQDSAARDNLERAIRFNPNFETARRAQQALDAGG